MEKPASRGVVLVLFAALASKTPARRAPDVPPAADACGDRDDNREHDLEPELDVDAECVSRSHTVQPFSPNGEFTGSVRDPNDQPDDRKWSGAGGRSGSLRG
jgi:hypothetical protein